MLKQAPKMYKLCSAPVCFSAPPAPPILRSCRILITAHPSQLPGLPSECRHLPLGDGDSGEVGLHLQWSPPPPQAFLALPSLPSPFTSKSRHQTCDSKAPIRITAYNLHSQMTGGKILSATDCCGFLQNASSRCVKAEATCLYPLSFHIQEGGLLAPWERRSTLRGVHGLCTLQQSLQHESGTRLHVPEWT